MIGPVGTFHLYQGPDGCWWVRREFFDGRRPAHHQLTPEELERFKLTNPAPVLVTSARSAQ